MDYSEKTISLAPGTTELMDFDAVVEKMDPDFNVFGLAPLLSLLKGQNETVLSELIARIVEGIQDHRSGDPSADDLTLLAIRRN